MSRLPSTACSASILCGGNRSMASAVVLVMAHSCSFVLASSTAFFWYDLDDHGGAKTADQVNRDPVFAERADRFF